ncbi:oxidoreductase [Paenibacillus physcomitrellae]|uniref:Oxidoreductase n=2 Tax=Paenibacillus physcomitrellae TaxID=1619311 RepID=A0ABQ1G6N4_9BACL|nr:oxidoreductase [Paenibacillus physcomitrellae]
MEGTLNMENLDATMRAIRFHEYGEPTDVLRLEEVTIPEPGPGRIRVRVRACGLNPVDWVTSRGHFAGQLPLPRGIGLDVAGIVDAIGEGVTDAAIGDAVLGGADFMSGSSAGASDQAIMYYWFRMPAGLDFVQAAALPMAVETAYRGIDTLGVKSGQTVFVHGAGTTVGFAAVQIALMRGARVIATAGATYADKLRVMGALVTSYGDGMIERVTELAKGPVDLSLDTAPISGSLRDLVRIVNGHPQQVLTVSDFAAAAELGVRASYGELHTARYDVVGDFAGYAADGKFTVPVAKTFALDDWRTAVEISLSGSAHGKLVLLPDSD